MPFCSVQTIKVSDRVIQVSSGESFSGDTARRERWDRTLLFLIASVFGDFGFQQNAIWLIFRFDKYSRFVLFEMRGTRVSLGR